MENSKLFSNEPLKQLKTHIQELQILLKKEQDKTKTLKKILWKIQDLSRQGKRKELSHLIDKSLHFTSNLNHSFLLTSTQVNGISDIFPGLVKIFQDRLRSPFKDLSLYAKASILSSKHAKNLARALTFSSALSTLMMRVRRMYFRIFINRKQNFRSGTFLIKSVVAGKLSEIWNKLRIQTQFKKIIIEKFDGRRKSIRQNFIKTFERIINARMTRVFNLIVKLKPDEELSLKPFNKYRRNNKRLMKRSEIEKLCKTIEKYYLRIIKTGFMIFKIPAEAFIVIEQGLVVLSQVLNTKIKSSKSLAFKSITPTKLITIQKKFALKLLMKHLKQEEFKLKFKFFSIFKSASKAKNRKSQLLASLNPFHHNISEKLILISTLPTKISKSLKKSAFLTLVSHVSYQISYDLFEDNCLLKMGEILKSFSIKKIHKSWNLWKTSFFSVENSFFTNCSHISERVVDPQKVRLAFINLNLIMQRQLSLNKSQSFVFWQDLVGKDRKKSYFGKKENMDRELKKKRRIGIHLPLKLNNNVLNINN